MMALCIIPENNPFHFPRARTGTAYRMAAPSLLFSHLDWMIVYIPLFVVILACKFFFWFEVLYLRKPTLSSVPGPKLAAWTRFWIVKTLASGHSAQIFVGVNKRYGKSL